MIQSQYILDIFDLSFEDHPNSDLLKKQIPFLTLTEMDHTGVGAFIHFKADEGISQFKLDTSSTSFDIDGNSVVLFDGVEIRNSNLSILADTLIHLKNGIIDHLEIFNKCGKDYVKTEPDHYELHQLLSDISKRRVIKR